MMHFCPGCSEGCSCAPSSSLVGRCRTGKQGQCVRRGSAPGLILAPTSFHTASNRPPQEARTEFFLTAVTVIRGQTLHMSGA